MSKNEHKSSVRLGVTDGTYGLLSGSFAYALLLLRQSLEI